MFVKGFLYFYSVKMIEEDNKMSLHGHKIVSYDVNFASERLTLHTEHGAGEAYKICDISFCSYFTHKFNDAAPNSVLFDIEKYDIPSFIEDHQSILEKKRKYNWPMKYETEEELIKYLSDGDYYYYVISSVSGLYGWVLAKEMAVLELAE